MLLSTLDRKEVSYERHLLETFKIVSERYQEAYTKWVFKNPDQPVRRNPHVPRQQKETNTCAMHALNNVIGDDLFTVEDFAKVSGHSKGWWSTWHIIEVCNSMAGKRGDWEYYTPGDNPTFSEEKFESLLARQIARNDDANDRIHGDPLRIRQEQ